MAVFNQMALDFPVQDQFVFDTFIVQPANRSLIDSLCDINQAGAEFIYLWGSRACGRTHLLQALCHELDHEQSESAVYLPLSECDHYSPEIFDGLQSMSLVCLDDIHALYGRTDWQEALFHLFNRIHESACRLVVSADCAPRQLKFDLADLGSRMAWGLTFQVGELDDEGKAEALRVRAAQRGIELSDEILNYILLRSGRDLEALLQVLDMLDTLSLVEKRKVTIPFIRERMYW